MYLQRHPQSPPLINIILSSSPTPSPSFSKRTVVTFAKPSKNCKSGVDEMG